MKRDIAFFDFDGTITKSDSLFDFIKMAVGKFEFYKGLFVLSPLLLGHLFRIIPNYKAKERLFKYYFKDKNEKVFNAIARKYALNYIDKITKLEALDKINWHKSQDHEVVIVSASIENWIKPWSDNKNIALLATKIEVINNSITGNFLTKNCYGLEKVKRIKEKYNLKEYNKVFVYGDSKGDKEMLELASKKERFFRCF